MAVAALATTADAIAIKTTGFISYADLSQFDTGAVARSQVAHEGTEIDAMIGREIKRDFAAVIQAFNINHFHFETVLANQANHFFLIERLVVLEPPETSEVFGTGFPENRSGLALGIELQVGVYTLIKPPHILALFSLNNHILVYLEGMMITVIEVLAPRAFEFYLIKFSHFLL
jgi:hypothetical protein